VSGSVGLTQQIFTVLIPPVLSAVRGLAMRDQSPGVYFSVWQLPVALSFKPSIWSCLCPEKKCIGKAEIEADFPRVYYL